METAMKRILSALKMATSIRCLTSSPRYLALRTRAEAAQVVEGIDTGRMTIVPKDLESISSYKFCAVRFQRFDTEHR
jgi:hypothetical protein